jgi:ferric-dicitrate binding protein FerR (iron transport regulator)
MNELSDANVTERETDLWERYLAGELSLDEVAELHQIVQMRGEDVRLLSAIAELFDTTPQTDLSQLWLDRLHARMGQVRRPVARRLTAIQPFLLRLSMTGAAIAAAVLGAVVIARQWHVPVAPKMATYVTRPGERGTIELTDGTVISLNVASRLEVPQDFGVRSRTVHLTGEADFHVMHHTDVPFTVEAGGTRAIALGTEFGVRAYAPSGMQVAVRTGRIMIHSVVLGARDVAMVTPAGMTVAHDQDLDAALGFALGRLVLNNVPLQQALPDLERWYDVKIQLRDPSIGATMVHAVLTNGSVGDLMEALRVALGLHVVCVGRTLTLDRR